MGDPVWKRITASSLRLSAMPIQINDDSAPSVDRLLSYVRGMDVDIVFVDYVQRLKAPKTASIYERVSAVAQALKEVARECSVPVVALAQINRAGASGARMEHLKGSGDIEQEADVVMILERKEENDRLATLTIDKNRHGPTGLLNLVFNPSLMEFLEQDTQHDDAY
jgi:replicative DNA helicase